MNSAEKLVQFINAEDINNPFKEINSPALYNLDSELVTKAQHALSKLIHNSTKIDILREDFNDLVESCDENGNPTSLKTMNAEINEIHFRHSSDKFTSAFLNSVSKMSDNHFEIATLTRAGLKLITGSCHCQNCNKNNENIVIDGSYGLTHSNKLNQARNSNHNNLQRALYSAVKKLIPGMMIQNNPLISQSIALKDPKSTVALSKIFADLRLISDERNIVIDARICSTVNNNSNEMGNRSIYDMSNQGDKSKQDEYKEYKITPKNFSTFTFDVFGVPSKNTSILINSFTDEAMKYNPHLPRSKIISLFRQQISVAMQINTANSTIIMMNNCNPNVPCNNNVILTNKGISVRI